MDVTNTGATSDTVAAAELPFKAAVIVAALSAAIVAVLTLNDAAVAPTTGLSETGTLTNDPEDASAMLLPARAGFESVIVQLPVVFGPRLEGTHCSEVTHTGATSDTLAAAVLPFKAAVITAVLSAGIAPVLIANVADIAPAATLTDVGTVASVEPEVIRIWFPPASAGLDKATLHVADVFGPRAVGLHWSPVTNTGATSDRLVFTVPPFAEALSFAVPSTNMTPPLTAKFADVAPAGTITVGGSVTAVVSEASARVIPPAAAAPPNVTVQLLETDGPTADGEQVRPTGVGR